MEILTARSWRLIRERGDLQVDLKLSQVARLVAPWAEPRENTRD